MMHRHERGHPQAQPPYLSGQITIRTLCLQHGIDLVHLGRESGIDTLTIWDVCVGNPHKQEVIGALLSTINRMTGMKYSLMQSTEHAG